jgi:hypothetical protein
MCRYCHPELAVQTPALAGITQKTGSLRGITIQKIPTLSELQPPEKPYVFPYYLELLQLTRQDLLDFLDNKVGRETAVVRTTETRPKSTSDITYEIATITKRIEDMVARRVELAAEIKQHRRTKYSYSAQAMKYGTKDTPPRAEDNWLDPVTQRRYIREEERAIERKEQLRKELAVGIKNQQKILDGLQQRLDTWGDSPEDREVVTQTITRDVTLLDVMRDDLSQRRYDAPPNVKAYDVREEHLNAYVSLP